MIADIFYPISTLTITVLAYFIREKNCSGALHPLLNQGITHGPLGAYSSPRPPAVIVFGFPKNRCAHIFSALSPDITSKIHCDTFYCKIKSGGHQDFFYSQCYMSEHANVLVSYKL